MRWITALGAVLLLASCRPRPGSERTSLPPIESRRNDAASLAERASMIVAIEIVALDDRRVIARCDDALLDAVRRSIAEGGRDGLTATPPAWPIVLRLVLREGPPFIAHLVGQDRLRLCPADPWRDCIADPPTPAEVAVPFELFEAVAREVGLPPRREYRTDDGPSPF